MRTRVHWENTFLTNSSTLYGRLEQWEMGIFTGCWVIGGLGNGDHRGSVLSQRGWTLSSTPKSNAHPVLLPRKPLRVDPNINVGCRKKTQDTECKAKLSKEETNMTETLENTSFKSELFSCKQTYQMMSLKFWYLWRNHESCVPAAPGVFLKTSFLTKGTSKIHNWKYA